LVAVLLSIFFGKVPLSNFVCGTALKSYIGGTDFSERQNHVFDKKMVYLAQFNILLGYYFKIFEVCEVTYRKYALKQGNRIGVRFTKYDIQGVFLKCAEILPTRLFYNVED
jgi:hypothetical protein